MAATWWWRSKADLSEALTASPDSFPDCDRKGWRRSWWGEGVTVGHEGRALFGRVLVAPLSVVGQRGRPVLWLGVYAWNRIELARRNRAARPRLHVFGLRSVI